MSKLKLLLIAAPAAAASMAVLAIATVGRNIWIVQILAIALACLLAVLGLYLSRAAKRSCSASWIMVVLLLGLAMTLLADTSAPQRWVSVGSVYLYMAPALLPAFLVACSALMFRGGRSPQFASAAFVGVSAILAAQPDASQALALLAATAFAVVKARLSSFPAILGLLLALFATVWACSQPDPLSPVAYVEGVFALALGHSLLAGIAVIASAAALVVGLCLYSSERQRWPSVVAVYYAVLFACSIAGLTPAPLIGYGAGPWIGFGLMVALASAIDTTTRPSVR